MLRCPVTPPQRGRLRARYGGGAFARLRSASAISRRRCLRMRSAMPSPYARGANRAITREKTRLCKLPCVEPLLCGRPYKQTLLRKLPC